MVCVFCVYGGVLVCGVACLWCGVSVVWNVHGVWVMVPSFMIKLVVSISST